MKKQPGVNTSLEDALQTHIEIMSKLEKVCGYESSYVQINGNCYYWCAKVLPASEAIKIARRQNHEELMLMIHKYGQAAPSSSWYMRSGCKAEYNNEHILPDEVQEIIAERCNDEELEAFTSYQGFGLAGQKKFFLASNHAQKMRYLARHGFLPYVQDMLRYAGNQEEIDLHISRHGMHFGWEKDILESNNFELFKHCVSLHDFSVPGQKLICRTGGIFFDYYITQRGFDSEVHQEMVTYRNESEIKRYIQLHRFLCFDGEVALCRRHNHELIMFYIEHKYPSPPTLRQAFQETKRIVYSEIFACLEKERNDEETKKWQIHLTKFGSEAEILEIVQDTRLCAEALKCLLERKLPKVLKYYYERWGF